MTDTRFLYHDNLQALDGTQVTARRLGADGALDDPDNPEHDYAEHAALEGYDSDDLEGVLQIKKIKAPSLVMTLREDESERAAYYVGGESADPLTIKPA